MTITRFAPASTAVSFAEIEAHEFKHIQDIITAPAPSGGDDSKAIEEAYEELGKSGIIQLRKGTYKFDAGVKFRKWAVWLRGMGAAGEEVESKLLNAGTMITCNSKNKPAIECSIPGTRFSDFAILNNTSTELATLSEALSSSGAAITELPVKELAEAIPNKTKIKTLSGAGPFELGTLSETLSEAAPITKFKVNALAGAIPATNTKGKTKVTLNDGAGHTQVFTMTAEAASGATEIKVESLKPNFKYPLTTTKVEGGNFFQNWVLTAEAAAKATKIKVESLKPNFSYATSSVVEGGPFPGSLGILANTANAAGEEGKTEGNCRGRYTDVDIEGFYENMRINGGRTQNITRCKFNGHVQYGLRLGDPIFFDAGEHEIFNCWFCATKQRTPAAHIEWESGGGVMVADSTFIFNPENEAVSAITEYCVDFTENIGKAFSTSEINVHNNEFEGFTKTGVRVQNTIIGEQIQSIIISNNNFRSFSAATNPVCAEVTSAFAGNFKGIVVTGNAFDPEGTGTCMKFKNAKPITTAGNTGFGSFGKWVTLEGESSSAIEVYPPTTGIPVSDTVNVAHAGIATNYFLTVFGELIPNEELSFEVNYGPTEPKAEKSFGTFQLKAPSRQIFSYLTAEATGVITAVKIKATTLNIGPLTKLKLINPLNPVENDSIELAPTNTEVGKLSAEIKTGAAIVELPVNALPNGVVKTSTIQTNDGAGHTQTWKVNPNSAAHGATSIEVTSQEPNFNYPAGTKVEGTEVRAGATEIKVLEKTLGATYVTATTAVEEAGVAEKLWIQAGPFLVPGAYKYEIKRTDGSTASVKTQKYVAP